MSYTCNFCHKHYVRKSAFNNHLLKCRFNNICKISSTEDISINAQDICKLEQNNENIMKILMHLHNKIEKLESDNEELKKFVNISKNKINILDHLNANSINLEFDFTDYMNSVNITEAELEIIFKKDYVDGILDIITNYIINIKDLKNKNINNNFVFPIKAFSHKDNTLFIYSKIKNSWEVMSNDDFNNLIKYFDKKIMTKFLEWKTLNNNKLVDDSFSKTYVFNMKKVIGCNFENKNKQLLIKNKLYKYLKVNIKNISTYEFT